jgi:hypothetical protein
MITAQQIISCLNENSDDRYSSFVRGIDVLNYRNYLSLDAENCFEWTDKQRTSYFLVLEKIPVEPSQRIILRVVTNETSEDFEYQLLNDYPTLPEVLLAYGRLTREARETGAVGISYPNEEIWKKLQSNPS